MTRRNPHRHPENDMHYLYLHGFNSGPNSRTAQQLQAALPNVHIAAYDSYQPDRAAQQIQQHITQLRANSQPLLLIGTSLGGFWADYFAWREQLPAIAINPCTQPHNMLRPFLGPNHNFSDGLTYPFTPENLACFAAYQHQATLPHLRVLVYQGDELIPWQSTVAHYQGRAAVQLLPGGEHRITALGPLLSTLQCLTAENCSP